MSFSILAYACDAKMFGKLSLIGPALDQFVFRPQFTQHAHHPQKRNLANTSLYTLIKRHATPHQCAFTLTYSCHHLKCHARTTYARVHAQAHLCRNFEDSCSAVSLLRDRRSARLPLRIVFTICICANVAQARSLGRNLMLACSVCCLSSSSSFFSFYK